MVSIGNCFTNSFPFQLKSNYYEFLLFVAVVKGNEKKNSTYKRSSNVISFLIFRKVKIDHKCNRKSKIIHFHYSDRIGMHEAFIKLWLMFLSSKDLRTPFFFLDIVLVV